MLRFFKKKHVLRTDKQTRLRLVDVLVCFFNVVFVVFVEVFGIHLKTCVWEYVMSKKRAVFMSSLSMSFGGPFPGMLLFNMSQW